MADEQISAVTQIRAMSGRENVVRQQLLALAESARAEAGCINYDLHQSVDDDRHFVFCETWTNRRALEDHLRQPYLREFVHKTGDLLEDAVEIIILRPVTSG